MMPEFHNFGFRSSDSIVNDMIEEQIHKSVDTYFERFMSKLSTYPSFTSTSSSTGLFFPINSFSNLLDDETALLNGENDGKTDSYPLLIISLEPIISFPVNTMYCRLKCLLIVV